MKSTQWQEDRFGFMEMKNNKAVPTLTKTFLLLIFLCKLAFSVTAQEIPNNAEPLAPGDAFVMDHIVVGPSEAVIRWRIPKYYYLYKEKFAFSSKDFIIEGVQFPLPEIKDDPFFGPSEIYHNVVEATLRLTPKTEGNSKGILDIAYQGCWEGGVCYPLLKTSIKLSGL